MLGWEEWCQTGSQYRFGLLAVGLEWAMAAGQIEDQPAAHGVRDLVHHPRAVTTPVRTWYPPFCVAFDVVLAVFILMWLPMGETA